MPKKDYILDNPIERTLEQQAVSVLYEEFVKRNPWSSDYALRFGWYLVENLRHYQEIVKVMKETIGTGQNRVILT